MPIIDRYLFRVGFAAFLVALLALTGVIWITQSLRQFDLLTTQGQTFWLFLGVTGLTIPSLVMIIAPIALFLAVVFALNRLNGDSELVVLGAAGMSTPRLLRPFALLILLVAFLVAAMSLYVMPWSFYQLRNILTLMRTDFLTRIVAPGQFTTLDQGFVIHYRERAADGALRGIFLQDRRDPEHITTYIAESGRTAQSGGESVLVLDKGSVQRQGPDSRDPIMVVFDRYAIDLSQFGEAGDGAALKPRERSTADLLSLDRSDPYVAANEGHFQAELSDRLVNPLYAVVLGLVGFAALGRPRTSRQSRAAAITGAVLVVLALRIAGFGASALLNRNPSAAALVYGLPIVGLIGALAAIFARDWRGALRRRLPNAAFEPVASPGKMLGATLFRYLAIRFASMILGVFGTIFLLTYFLDFVETLRRAGDVPGTPALLVAYLSVLRVPSIVEQVLPFAVLGGSMFAFLSLSRRLELVVVRSAGVSVWQFLAPAVLVVLAIGVFSVVVANPVAARMKASADRIETRIFGQRGKSDTDTSMWIRQKSDAGQSILRADTSSDAGSELGAVTAFVFAPTGEFEERVEAAHASLHPGFWLLTDARVSAPGKPVRALATYRLGTNLTASQVTQYFVAPDSVSFWALRSVARQSELAGLDATGYRLRFQSLLARPLLLVAMVVIAACVSLRFFRSGGVARMVSGGVAAGFLLYVSTKLVGDLGGAGLLDTAIAAWSPAVVATLFGAFTLLHQEDG